MSGKLKLAGVVGYPAAHSKSPLMHNHWLKTFGLNGVYTPYEIAPEDFEGFARNAWRYGLAGFNITIPHKEAAFALSDALTPAAERCGSVNTIIYQEGGRILGDSTDGYGFIESVRQGAPALDFSGATVAMLGAGGAARSVIAGLLDAGVEKVRLANRTEEKVEALASVFGAGVEPWSWPVVDAFYDGAALLVNATSLGMTDGPSFDWRLPALAAGVVATDLIYAPLETPFLAAARARGAHVVDGLGMLLHQARPGFAQWFGRDPQVTPELRELVLSKTGFLP